MVTEHRLLSVTEIADRLGVTKAAVYRWVSRGLFPRPLALGRASRWTEEDLQSWIASCPRKGTQD